MLTTLTNARALSSPVIKYKLIKNLLTIIIEAGSAHKLYGDVNITLANVKLIPIYTDVATIVADFFNQTFKFTAVSTTRLECEIDIANGLTETVAEVTLSNNGSAITATTANNTFSLPIGTYIFDLLNTNDSVFDSALITFQQNNVGYLGNTGISGIIDSYTDVSNSSNDTIDQKILTFVKPVTIALSGATSNTNVPLSWMRYDRS